MQVQPPLRPTSWLAQRLGLSISSIERLRAAGSPDLLSAILIGNSVRYDENVVEQWLRGRQQAPVTSSTKTGGDDVLLAP
jgi:predicted DNA-binding transcriptional regulator AlpA